MPFWQILRSGILSYVAMANTSCGKKVNVKDVREAVTIQDLYNLLK